MASTTPVPKEDAPLFVRKEREHLAALQERLDWIHQEHGEKPDGYVAGEANALRWALDLITGIDEAAEVKLTRHELRIRLIEGRLHKVEQWIEEAEEEVD